jgi:hypothetical protein
MLTVYLRVLQATINCYLMAITERATKFWKTTTKANLAASMCQYASLIKKKKKTNENSLFKLFISVSKIKQDWLRTEPGWYSRNLNTEHLNTRNI